jgi:hypothetical protein
MMLRVNPLIGFQTIPPVPAGADPTLWYGINDLFPATTWNPADKNANVVLSNGNLTIATPAWNGNHQMVRATNSVPPNGGKVYWEILESGIGTAAQSYVTMLGIAQGGTPLANGEYISQLGQGVGQGYAADAANTYLNGWTGTSSAGIAGGNHAFAYDSYTGRLWWAPSDGGSWWGGNPFTGASPMYVRSGAAIPMFPALSYLNVSTHTANFGPNFNAGVSSIVGARQGGSSCKWLVHADMYGLPDRSPSAFITGKTGGLNIVGSAKFGNACVSFPGSAQYFFPTGSNIVFGTGDFTIDLWFWVNSWSGNRNLFDFQPGVAGIYPTTYMSGDGKLHYYVNGADRIVGVTSAAANNWHHYALTRVGTTTRQFLNGIQDGAPWVGDTNNYLGHSQRPLIGIWGVDGASNPWLGKMQEIRILQGVGAWSSNFTPPTAPYT